MSIERRAWRELLLGWCTRALIAASVMATLEVLFVCAFVPFAGSDASGLVHLTIILIALYGLLAIPFSLIGVLIDRRPRTWPKIDTAILVALVFCVSTQTFLINLLRRIM